MNKHYEFLADNTKDIESVCELGAGIFRHFHLYKCPIRIGVELIQGYVDARINREHTTLAVCGDIREFDTLGLPKVDAFALIDIIEHLEKDESIELLLKLQKHADRIFMFVPHGTCHQVGSEAWDFNQHNLTSIIRPYKTEAIEAQRHKSTWYVKDLEALGFEIDLDEEVQSHKPKHIYGDDGGGIMWAVWNKREN